ncbi:hypothetical protein [Ammoniphilus sp. YIM 78166]|uniref:hypothetical protein n=1 Tax=Ammoniphilus sp. YIM 78166 TaxID=1644106 RepID=UPI00106F305E|nr:hypothetical protein [Ammoniphilus sp. YIM 78166]
MIGFDWLNNGSIVLGIIAWILPVVNFGRYEKHYHWVTRSIMSISACVISLSFQIFYIYHKVKIEEWSTLLDTMDAIAFVSAVLLSVTIILNGITLFVYRDRTAKQVI